VSNPLTVHDEETERGREPPGVFSRALPRDDETRAWAKRFYERMKRMPHMRDAGDYSLTMHYLKAIQEAGTDEAQAVMAKCASSATRA